MQLGQVLTEVKDGGQLLIDELAELRPPFIIWTEEPYVQLFDEREVIPLLNLFIIALLSEELLVQHLAQLLHRAIFGVYAKL